MSSFDLIHDKLIANSIPHDVASKAALMISGVADAENLSELWIDFQIKLFLADYISFEGDIEKIFTALDTRLKEV